MLKKRMVYPVWGGSGLGSEVKLKFSGHESFSLRFSWVPKAIKQISNNPKFFSQDDAFVKLGVGKNMAMSIRHWCNILGLIEKGETPGELVLTHLAETIFGPTGFDPFLESDASLWLLHWMLAGCDSSAGSIKLAFSRWNEPTITKNSMVSWLQSLDDEVSTSSEAVISRDVEVMIKTYTKSKVGRYVPLEDSFDSPLSELGMLVEDGSQSSEKVFRFNRGEKNSLPVGILAYAINRYWISELGSSSTVRLESISHAIGAPGAVFKLTQNNLFDMIESMPKEFGFGVTQTAGIAMISRDSSIVDEQTMIVHAYTGVLR